MSFTKQKSLNMCNHILMCKMSNMTLAIPNALYTEMKKHSEIRWSEVARQAIAEKIDKLELAEKLAKKSKLTKKDVEEFSKMIKSKAAKRLAKYANSN